MTRQSPHIFSRSAAGALEHRVAGAACRAWPRSPSACRTACRSARSGTARPRAARAPACAPCRRRPATAAAASVMASSGQVLAHRPHCTQFFSMKRSCGRSGCRPARLGAGADAAQAQRALVRVDDNRAERRAGRRQRDRLGCGRRLREQMVERQIERRALVGLHAEASPAARTAVARRRPQRRVERLDVARHRSSRRWSPP